MAGQRALEPDEEEVREIGVGHSKVVGRVGEPDLRRLAGQRVCGCVGVLGRSVIRAHYDGSFQIARYIPSRLHNGCGGIAY